jgi:tetratricopeptide (TPR) repeat protein
VGSVPWSARGPARDLSGGLAVEEIGDHLYLVTDGDYQAMVADTGKGIVAFDAPWGALEDLRRFDEAITACQDAAAIFRDTGDRLREGMALGNLGTALQEVRRFDEAITAHQDAATIYRETGDRHGEDMALGNLKQTRGAQQA